MAILPLNKARPFCLSRQHYSFLSLPSLLICPVKMSSWIDDENCDAGSNDHSLLLQPFQSCFALIISFLIIQDSLCLHH